MVICFILDLAHSEGAKFYFKYFFVFPSSETVVLNHVRAILLDCYFFLKKASTIESNAITIKAESLKKNNSTGLLKWSMLNTRN